MNFCWFMLAFYDIASEDYWIATEQTGTDGNERELQVRAW